MNRFASYQNHMTNVALKGGGIRVGNGMAYLTLN